MRHTFLLTVVIALSCSPAWAQVYDQKSPSVATASDGSYVITWEDKLTTNVFARRYSASGSAQGAAPFQVSTSTGIHKKPIATMAADGSFIVVIWEHSNVAKTVKNILARRYDNSSGWGSEFQINTTTGDHKSPIVSIVYDATNPSNPFNGRFMVVWENNVPPVINVLARRYDKLGNALDNGERKVNTSALENKKPDVSASFDGSFVVVWENKDPDKVTNPNKDSKILAQQFDASGVAVNGELQISASGPGENKKPHIGSAKSPPATVSFVIAWEYKTKNPPTGNVYTRRYGASGNPLGAPDSVGTLDTQNLLSAGPTLTVGADGRYAIAWEDKNAKDVLVRLYDTAGIPVTAVQRINTSSGQHKKPQISMASDGSFVVVWEAKTATDVYARRYDASGNAIGGEIVVNTTTLLDQKKPIIAMAPDGAFVVVWEDKNTREIFGQRFDASGNPICPEFSVNINPSCGVRVLNWTEVPNRGP